MASYVGMVTRTIKSTECEVMVVNTTTAEVENRSVSVPKVCKNPTTLMNQVKKLVETDEIKAVQIVSSKVTDGFYGMSEADFIKYAKRMEPRQVKADEAADQEPGYTNDNEN